MLSHQDTVACVAEHGKVIAAVAEHIGIIQRDAVMLQYQINGRCLGMSSGHTFIFPVSAVYDFHVPEPSEKLLGPAVFTRDKIKLIIVIAVVFPVIFRQAA